MKHYLLKSCRYCCSSDLVKNGKSLSGHQRSRCNSCRRSFQLNYDYNAYIVGVDEAIESQTLNRSGIRDIGRNLKISKDTVVNRLKKKQSRKLILIS